ncbi:MAG: hypothetical protein HQ564_08040 [Candidatus Saganbacteria bacterium]|nr:hypothetical protein [Candidatus Saganbacteria bacterium]
MGKIFKLILGIALILLGAFTIVLWWADLLTLIRGGIGLLLIFFGLVFFALMD